MYRIRSIVSSTVKYALFLLIFASLVTIAASAQDDDSLDIKLGQMLLVGFRGFEVKLTSTIVDDIKGRHIGGVILYDFDVPTQTKRRNIITVEQSTALINKLKGYATIPLFVAIDQEGGFVSRIKEEYGFKKSYSQEILGKKNDTAFTRQTAIEAARQLDMIGVNVNFAPVVDVNTNKDNPVIAEMQRSFSANPEKVVRHSRKIIEGMHEYGILCAIKHFPGHGSSFYDSHEGLANVTTTWDPLELMPFSTFIKEDACDLIMTAHIFNGKLDSEHPATLSYPVVTGLLRDSLGWNGVVVSDDLMMEAITSFYGLEKAIELAINAGVDILLFSNNSHAPYDDEIAAKALRIMKHYVQNGKIKMERINDAYYRIMRLKQRMKN